MRRLETATKGSLLNERMWVGLAHSHDDIDCQAKE
jgi:hypothetical protein